MTDPFDIARARINEIKNSINPWIEKAFKDYGYVIKEYQTIEQLYKKGQDSKGSLIRPAYTPYTIKIKKSKGQPTDRVTWKDTGRLYDSIKVIASKESVEITTSVEYAAKLFKKYGDNVLGIQEELLRKFMNDYLLPELKKDTDDKIARA